MAEFQEVMKQWRRFCKSHNHCGECVFDGKGICGEAHLSDVPYANIELRIMEWAAEHPEPVYPTWGEYFISTGELIFGWAYIENPDALRARCAEVFCKPIPADIAPKLGLKPKEG